VDLLDCTEGLVAKEEGEEAQEIPKGRLLEKVSFLLGTSTGEVEAMHAETLHNVYLFGSRAYGTHLPGADYDLIAIVEGPYFEGPKLIEEKDVNVNLYHRVYFSYMLKECLVWCLLVLFLPREFVLKEDIKFTWHLSKLKLRKSAYLDSKHNFQKAKRSWKEGDIYKAKKNIVHGIRYLQFGIQLLERGAIYDLEAANTTWEEVKAETNQSWSFYEAKYKPVYEKLVQTMNLLAKPLQLQAKKQYEKANRSLKTLEYIEKFGLDALTRELSVSVTVHREHPNLYHLCADKVDSPANDPVVRECAYGLIIELTEGGAWRVASLPYTKFFGHHRIEALPIINKISWKTARVTEKVEGAMATLYCHRGKWYVSSWESPDGSEVHVSVATDDNKRYYYSHKPSYNPWKFFEAKLEWAFSNEKFDEERLRGYFPNQVASVLASPAPPKTQQVAITFAELFWSIWNEKGYHLPCPDEHIERMPSSLSCFVFMFCLSSERLSLVLSAQNTPRV